MSNEMTLDDLRRILIACAGGDETAELACDLESQDFEELGYDSLALMETAARIEQEYGVRIPDEQVAELKTPQELLKLVNDGPLEAA